MTIEERIARLPVDQQLKVVLRLLRQALPIWEKHLRKEGISYADSVVGMHHVISPGLVPAILDTAEKLANPKPTTSKESLMARMGELKSEILEPVVALQDDDLQLPDPVMKTLYAAYNVVNHFCSPYMPSSSKNSLGIAANQAVDALITSGKWNMDHILENWEAQLSGD